MYNLQKSVGGELPVRYFTELLAQALGTTPEFWLNLESTYRLKTFDASAMPKVEALA